MSQTNAFSKTSDTKTIIRFVKEIERHPSLYDAKSPAYMDRELKRRTWMYIARKFNSTVSDCKEKWTKIRTAYIRTLRPSYNDGVRTFSRPYYLAHHLKFISPMKKKTACRGKFCSSKSEKSENSETEETDANKDESENSEGESNRDENSQHQVFLNEDTNPDDNDDYDDDNDEMKGYINLEIEAIDTRSNDGSKTEDKVSGNSNENDTSSCQMDKPKPCSENIEYNPRKMFLFSLLPDIEDLNEQQMRVFRRDVIKLIDKVMMD